MGVISHDFLCLKPNSDITFDRDFKLSSKISTIHIVQYNIYSTDIYNE